MQNRARPIASAVIDHVRIANRQSKEIALNDPVPAAANISAVNELELRRGRRKFAFTDDKRRPLKVDIPLVDGAKGQMIEPGGAADDVDGSRAVKLNMGITQARFRQ